MKRFIPIICLIHILVSSCSNRNDCFIPYGERKVELSFAYQLAGQEYLLSNKCEVIDLYVYDASDKLIQKKQISKKDLTAFAGTHLYILPGTYKVVCWGNMLQRTNIDNQTSLKDAKVIHHTHKLDKNYVHSIDSLYYGSCTLNVSDSYDQEIVRQQVSYTDVHYKVRVAIEEKVSSGKKLKSSEIPYKLEFKNMPYNKTFTKVLGQEKCDYIPTLRYADAGYIYAAFNSLRFRPDNKVQLNLIAGKDNKILYTLDLNAFLEKEGIDITNQVQVTIPILIQVISSPEGESGVTITVKKWDSVNLIPDV